MNVSFACIVWK